MQRHKTRSSTTIIHATIQPWLFSMHEIAIDLDLTPDLPVDRVSDLLSQAKDAVLMNLMKMEVVVFRSGGAGGT